MLLYWTHKHCDQVNRRLITIGGAFEGFKILKLTKSSLSHEEYYFCTTIRPIIFMKRQSFYLLHSVRHKNIMLFDFAYILCSNLMNLNIVFYFRLEGQCDFQQSKVIIFV